MAWKDKKDKQPKNKSRLTLNRKKLSRAIREKRVKEGYALRDLAGLSASATRLSAGLKNARSPSLKPGAAIDAHCHLSIDLAKVSLAISLGTLMMA